MRDKSSTRVVGVFGVWLNGTGKPGMSTQQMLGAVMCVITGGEVEAEKPFLPQELRACSSCWNLLQVHQTLNSREDVGGRNTQRQAEF